MKKVLQILLTIFILSAFNFAQTPDTMWTLVHGGSGVDYLSSVDVTADGGFIFGGSSNVAAWLIKTNNDGVIQWEKTYQGSVGSILNEVQQTADGGYIFTGATNILIPNGTDLWVVKTNVNGIIEWEQSLDGGSGLSGDVGHSVCQTSDGGYVIAGRAHIPSKERVWLVKLDANGQQQWNHQFAAGNLTQSGNHVRQTSDGGFIVVGYGGILGNQNGWDLYLLKTNENGNLLWEKFIGGVQEQRGHSVEQTSDGGYIVGGYTYLQANSNADAWLIKTDANGNVQWDNVFGGSGVEEVRSVVPDSDGGFCGIGITSSMGAGGSDILLFKTNSSGNMEWDITLGDSGNEFGVDLKLTSDGGYILAGGTNSFGSGEYDAWMVKVGVQQLIAWNNPNGGDFSNGLNWIGGVSPEDDQIALFDSSNYTSSSMYGQPITVSFNDITTTEGLTVFNSQVKFDLQLHSYEVSNLIIGGLGVPDESQLEIINGAIGTTNNLQIGTGSRPGQLIVSSGGILEVGDVGSDPLLQIGKGDCGGGDCARLIIQDGGMVNSNGVEVAGNNAQANILLNGPGSEWNDLQFIVIGDSGLATFDIISGGYLFGKRLFAGQKNNSQGTINVGGEDSKVFIDEFLNLGFFGNGTLNINNRAEVEIFDQTTLGVESGSNGELFVEGSGSKFTTNKLIIGDLGSGGLTVSDSALAILNDDVDVPKGNNGIGSILVDGESTNLDISGNLRIGYPGVGFVRLTNLSVLSANSIQLGPLGSIDVTGGIVYVGGNNPQAFEKYANIQKNNLFTGGSVYVDTLLISENGELLVNTVEFSDGGYLGGEGTFNFDVINSGGINPGDSINTSGLFTINANYTQQSNGTLFIELEGSTAGSGFDQLIVNGNAQISGILDISALNLFEPFIGQTFDVLLANNITGTFEEVITHRGLGISVSYSTDKITITITSPVSVDDNNINSVPTKYNLEQNYPNPFNPSTSIQYAISNRQFVSLKVYDVLGNEVATLVDEHKPAGRYEVEFSATDLTSGVYYYQIKAGDPSSSSGQGFFMTKKMILLK
ncbi:MAG: T9SS type A sorting domain-containing protein [Ignavibacteriaceae bacterium]